MIRKALAASCLSLLAIFPFALATAPRGLSDEEARGIRGGVCLDDYICHQVATCNTFNYPQAPACPNEIPCLVCSNGSTAITNCVQNTGTNCDHWGGGTTECGDEMVGPAGLLYYVSRCLLSGYQLIN